MWLATDSHGAATPDVGSTRGLAPLGAKYLWNLASFNLIRANLGCDTSKAANVTAHLTCRLLDRLCLMLDCPTSMLRRTPLMLDRPPTMLDRPAPILDGPPVMLDGPPPNARQSGSNARRSAPDA